MGFSKIGKNDRRRDMSDKAPLIDKTGEQYSDISLAGENDLENDLDGLKPGYGGSTTNFYKQNGHYSPPIIYEYQSDNETESKNEFKPKTLVEKIFPTGFKYELIGLLKYSWPMVATQLLNYSIGAMATMFSGHLGKIQLDSVTMAISIANMIGLSIGIGLIAACDTLFPQSYGSANKFQVGIYLQTAVYISSLCCILSWGLLANTNVILVALGQDPLVARYTEEYLNYYMPALEFLFLYQLFSKYLQVQGYVLPCVFIGIVSNIINVVLQYSLTYLVGMGIRGSAISQVVAFFSLGTLTILYTKFSGAYKGTWAGFSRKSLQDWGQFLKLGVSSIMMVCLEWWAYEIGTFLMGILGNTELGASSVLMTMWGFYSSLSIGIGAAAAFRSGRYLGAKKPMNALTTSRVSFCVAWCIAIFTAVFTLAFRTYIPYLFTTDPDVVNMATDMLPILSLFSLFGATRNICSGVIRGTGNQAVGGMTAFVSYFVFGLPTGIALMFLTSARASGFWWGLTLGLTINSSSLFVIIYKIDWVLESDKAQIRAKVQASIGRQISVVEETNIDFVQNKNSTATFVDEVRERLYILAPNSSKTTVSYGATQSKPGLSRQLKTEEKLKQKRTYWRKLFLLRALICFTCFGLLTFGIVCRVWIFLPPDFESNLIENVTQSMQINFTSIFS